MACVVVTTWFAEVITTLYDALYDVSSVEIGADTQDQADQRRTMGAAEEVAPMRSAKGDYGLRAQPALCFSILCGENCVLSELTT